MTGDLVAWLRQQLDDDQRGASQWHDLECDIHDHLDGDIHKAIAASRMLTEVPGAVCDCGGPARVLREVEAKRRIIADYERYAAERRRAMGGWESSEISPILTALAAVYADRNGYKEDWKP